VIRVAVPFWHGNLVMTRRRQPEFKIHTAVCEHLRLRAKPGVVWLHVPNQRNGDARTGAMLKRMGMLPGAPDLIIIHGGRCFGLEIKAEGGRPTEIQLATIAAMEAAGAYCCIAYGLDAAIATLEAWDLFGDRRK
jgi:hypothetical protein